jgi:hypothetical protein
MACDSARSWLEIVENAVSKNFGMWSFEKLAFVWGKKEDGVRSRGFCGEGIIYHSNGELPLRLPGTVRSWVLLLVSRIAKLLGATLKPGYKFAIERNQGLSLYTRQGVMVDGLLSPLQASDSTRLAQTKLTCSHTTLGWCTKSWVFPTQNSHSSTTRLWQATETLRRGCWA